MDFNVLRICFISAPGKVNGSVLWYRQHTAGLSGRCFRSISFQRKIPAPELGQIRGCRLSSSEHGLRKTTPRDQRPGRIRLMAILSIFHVHRMTSVRGSPDESDGQVGLLASGSIYLPRLPIPAGTVARALWLSMRLSSPVTATGPRRIRTVFPTSHLLRSIYCHNGESSNKKTGFYLCWRGGRAASDHGSGEAVGRGLS